MGMIGFDKCHFFFVRDLAPVTSKTAGTLKC